MGITITTQADLDAALRANPDAGTCGTVACACGWAALDPVLSEEGLRLLVTAQKGRDEILDRDFVSGGALPVGYTITGGYVAFDDEIGLEAAAAFFGLSYDRADALFDYPSYVRALGVKPHEVTPRMVIDRFRALLAEHEGAPPIGE